MNYKKLYESAKTPTRGSEEAAGFDLYACGYENQMCNAENWEVYINIIRLNKQI